MKQTNMDHDCDDQSETKQDRKQNGLNIIHKRKRQTRNSYCDRLSAPRPFSCSQLTSIIGDDVTNAQRILLPMATALP